MALRLARPPATVRDRDAAAGGAHARATGRSWWAVRYTDGRVIHEWDRDLGSPNGHADWPRIPKRGLQALRLYCPDGKMAQLGDSGDGTGRFFQFKVAARNVSLGGEMGGKTDLAHVIGMIVATDGGCVLYAWEPEPAPVAPHYEHFRQTPGAFAEAFNQYNLVYRDWARRGGGQLVGPIRDNVYWLQYQQVGPVNADHMGLRDGEGR